MSIGHRLLAARRAPARALIYVIELYRTYVSPTRLPVCRFTPTCSEYAVIALREHGLLRGGWLAVTRLAKCAPWHPGGWDPVPDRKPTAGPHAVTPPDAGVASPAGPAVEAPGAGADLLLTEQRST